MKLGRKREARFEVVKGKHTERTWLNAFLTIRSLAVKIEMRLRVEALGAGAARCEVAER
jgi:hypothetical protein